MRLVVSVDITIYIYGGKLDENNETRIYLKAVSKYWLKILLHSGYKANDDRTLTIAADVMTFGQ